MQLKVIKSDSSTESYAHTKVLRSLNNALAAAGEPNIFAAEQFAEAITFYFYKNHENGRITSDEIHLMAQTVLSATGNDQAAKLLKEHRLRRRIRRGRLEVIDRSNGSLPERWDKGRIINKLREQGVKCELARTIASSVEEKILNIDTSRVTKNIVHEFVETETESMLQAQRNLELISA